MIENIDTAELQQAINKISKLVDDKLDQLLSLQQNSELTKAAKYSSINPNGKKIRPLLVLQTARVFNSGSRESDLLIAAAIEMIHTYSLIHDDLPAIDNDDFRRGKLSCHKKFGESTAILTGNALLIFAFEILATNNALSDKKARLIISKLSQILGFNGMMYGQMLDIDATTKQISLSMTEKIHRLKTAKFMSISCEIGALVGDASDKELQNIEIFGNHLGMIFQITDDLLDQIEQKQSECNITKILNKEEVAKLLDQHTAKAIAALDQITGRDINLLKNLLFFLKNRTT